MDTHATIVIERHARDHSRTGGLEVRDVSVTVRRNTALLEGVSLTARRGTLTAVIGPSGAGKSTLAQVIAGARRPTGGAVSFDGRDVHADDPSMRSRIGLVPQDDVVHGRLTVAQALGFAAELRMPADTSALDRGRVVAEVLGELELTAHAAARIDTLSGGQRKRVSIAVELLTAPELLVLDEPTTGLDPALDRSVMALLRRLADAGRVVVVVTHCMMFLDMCDQVLLLAPGGRTAFCGPPQKVSSAMGATDWADIFADVAAAGHRFERGDQLNRDASEDDTVVRFVAQDHAKPARVSVAHQISTVARRQLRLLVADRRYLMFLAVLPFIVGVLPLTVAGDAGFGQPPSDGSAPFEPRHLVALMSFAAILLGSTLTVRDLVGERAVFRREQAAGLSATAYLLAKTLVFGAVATVQAAVLVLVVTAPVVGKPGPMRAAALGVPLLELFVGVAATCVVAAVMGLAVSALAHNGDQVVVLLAATLMAQLVLAGGFIPVTGRSLFETLAWLTPGRWGFAATASTVDLTELVAGIADDPHWEQAASTWLSNMLALGLLAALFAGITRWRIRLTV